MVKAWSDNLVAPPPALPGTREWFRIFIGGSEWTVLLVSPEGCAALEIGEEDDATCLQDLGIIALRDTIPYHRMVVLLVHEALHACFSKPGQTLNTARLLGCSIEEVCDREENIVTDLAPTLADAFSRAGILTLPPLPPKASP